jgi:tetratricopeptide (TPR) repeat protein
MSIDRSGVTNTRRRPWGQPWWLPLLLVPVLGFAQAPVPQGGQPVYRPLSPEEIEAAERSRREPMRPGPTQPPEVPSSGLQSYGPVYGAGLPPPPEPAAAVPSAMDEGLVHARRAYWAQDLAGAESAYRDLMDRRVGDPNPPGELGNLYYRQGRWQEAAEAYREAALRLARLDRFGQAMHMVFIVGGLDGQAGQALNQEVDAIRMGRR